MKRSKPHTPLPKQDPAGYIPGTPTLGQYQPKTKSAPPRFRPTPLVPGRRAEQPATSRSAPLPLKVTLKLNQPPGGGSL
jgi:hypothetical protein